MEHKEKATIAYLLLAHHKPNQLNIYINQLLTIGNCDIYIHVSKKNQDMINKIIKHPNVHVYSEYEVRWASYEIVASCIFLMEKALKSNNKYDFIHFGSGQDMVVKNDLLEYLAENKNKVFIKIQNYVIENNDLSSSLYRVKWPRFLMVRDDWHPYRLIRTIISRLCIKGINIYKNPYSLPDSWKVYGGRTWFTIPNEVAEYIIQFLRDTPEYIDFWYDSLVPDLFFFHVILKNSKFKDNISDELTYVQFGEKVGDCNHPKTLRYEDINKIETSKKFFARKFDENEDLQIIEYFKNKIK